MPVLDCQGKTSANSWGCPRGGYPGLEYKSPLFFCSGKLVVIGLFVRIIRVQSVLMHAIYRVYCGVGARESRNGAYREEVR